MNLNTEIVNGNDILAAKKQISQRVLRSGFAVPEDKIPQSVVGKDDKVRATYFVCESEAHLVVIGSMDLTIAKEPEGMDIGLCGYEWLVCNKANMEIVANAFVSDWFHAFGKGQATGSLKVDLANAGFENVEEMWDSYVEIANKHRAEMDALIA